MRGSQNWPRLCAVASGVFGFGLLYPGQASAHIKWFCAFNVAGQPRGLENVLCPDFELLTLSAILMLLAGYLVEMSLIGTALISALNRVTSGLRDNSETLMRATCGFFFVALWTKGGVLLTPELTTASPLIPWIQLGLAACLIWRRTMPITGLGIIGLFSLAIYRYGIFHLMDYPIFLGIAVYFILVGLQRNLFGMRPVDVLRWSASVTLMWASIEKWAYPEWSFPLFIAHPQMTFGYTPEFFMRAAGMVEFTLSFALILTPLIRRTAATILAGMFISAVFGFGKIDAIGHAPIVAVLFTVIADDCVAPRLTRVRLGVKNAWEKFNLRLSLWDFVLLPAGYYGALIAFLAIYYLLHSVLFGTKIA
jgi:hypothetical protein